MAEEITREEWKQKYASIALNTGGDSTDDIVIEAPPVRAFLSHLMFTNGLSLDKSEYV